MGYPKPCYERLWPTITHYDLQKHKVFILWPTMTKNLVNCFTKTQRKVLGHFIFLNFVSKIPFWGKFRPETWKCFWAIWDSGVLILNSTIAFSNSVSKITFFGKFGTETSKCFAWNETRYKGEFGGVDSEIDNYF